METRTIFFNGPRGHRWVTAPVPTLEVVSSPAPVAVAQDGKAHHRRSFFVALNALCSRLARYGLEGYDVRRYYANRFGVEGLSECSERQWSVAAAELQAMVRSKSIFFDRIAQFRGGMMAVQKAVEKQETKRRFIARWGVSQTRSRFGEVEVLYKQEEAFESPGVRAAKARATRLLKVDSAVVDLLKSEWYPEWFELRLRGWGDERISPEDPSLALCSRLSESEYKSQGKDEPSLEQWAFLYLFWESTSGKGMESRAKQEN